MRCRHQATKDAASCEKLRGAANTLPYADIRMGEPGVGRPASLQVEHIHLAERHAVKGNISGTAGKEIERDSVSSGERTRNSPNRKDLSFRGCRTTMWQHEG